MHDRLMRRFRAAHVIKYKGNQKPYEAGGKHDGFAFAQMKLFLKHDNEIGNNKQEQGQIAKN